MARDDQTIKKDVEDELFWDVRVDESNVEVEVDDHEATLKGTVPTYSQRARAFRDAYNIPGVFLVNNQLEVEFAEAYAIPTDGEIQSSIKNVLAANIDIDESDIEVEVDKGWVTLKGTVDAIWKKIVAEEDVSSVAGVTGITNELAITPAEDVVDKSIAEDIVSAIERSLYVDEDSVDVKVENGEVTLSGSVATRRGRDAAYDIALYTTGVTNVEDNLVVTSNL